MKTLLFIITTMFFQNQTHGQILKGQWEGSFMENGKIYPMFLEFTLNADSTYSVYSYSKSTPFFVQNGNTLTRVQNDSSIVCKVFYKFTPPDDIYLEEIEVVQPSTQIQDCFQKMYLKLKNEENKPQLIGKWKTNSGRCNSAGKISFSKIKE